VWWWYSLPMTPSHAADGVAVAAAAVVDAPVAAAAAVDLAAAAVAE